MRHVKLLLLLSWTLIVSLVSIADNNQKTTIPVRKTESNDQELNNKGHRVPSKLVICTIDCTVGVAIDNVDKTDFISFEIMDKDGGCLLYTTDEMDFVENFFIITEKYQIRICTTTHCFIGYIN